MDAFELRTENTFTFRVKTAEGYSIKDKWLFVLLVVPFYREKTPPTALHQGTEPLCLVGMSELIPEHVTLETLLPLSLIPLQVR